MASNYTAHYGLCQWEPGDSFMRTEFNGDNERVDAALHTLSGTVDGAARETSRALERLDTVSYNVYSLMLQNYYGGKDTGWKKALVFDGFRDTAGIASKSGAILQGDNCLTLSQKGQGNHDLGFGSQRNTALETRSVRMLGVGRLTGFRFKAFLDWSLPYRPELNYALTVNGTAVSSGTYEWSETCPPQEDVGLTLPFPAPIQVRPGDTLVLRFSQEGTVLKFYEESGGSGLGGTFLVTPLSAAAGTVTTRAVSLPAADRLLGWVRCSGGSIGLSVVDSAGKTRPMTAGESRSTADPLGNPCTEWEVILDEAVPAGNTAFRLDLSAPTGGTMYLYDYGVCLL